MSVLISLAELGKTKKSSKERRSKLSEPEVSCVEKIAFGINLTKVLSKVLNSEKFNEAKSHL